MKKLRWNFKSRQKMQIERNGLKLELPAGFDELTSEERKGIVAGESAAYWLGYLAGKVASIFS